MCVSAHIYIYIYIYMYSLSHSQSTNKSLLAEVNLRINFICNILVGVANTVSIIFIHNHNQLTCKEFYLYDHINKTI